MKPTTINKLIIYIRKIYIKKFLHKCFTEFFCKNYLHCIHVYVVHRVLSDYIARTELSIYQFTRCIASG